MLKAHYIAKKLKLDDFDKWICNELNGYDDAYRDAVPRYRFVHGRVIAKDRSGKRHTVTMPSTEFENSVSYQWFLEPIAEIQAIYNENIDGMVCTLLQPEINLHLNQISTTRKPMDFILTIAPHAIKSILEKVKIKLLDWLIELESHGIKGDNMEFTKNDSEVAKTVTQQVTNHYHGNVINGTVNNSPITTGSVGTITYDKANINELAQKVKESIITEPIKEHDKQDAVEMLEDVVDKVNNKKSSNVIRFALSTLRDFLINAGASITAAIISQYL
jgi:hypothetical protein